MQACDANGNRRCTGGDRFSLEIRGVAADAAQVPSKADVCRGSQRSSVKSLMVITLFEACRKAEAC